MAGRRFFPKNLARKPLPEIFKTLKPENNFRIFILGESAARGESLSDFSFARMLQAMLEESNPSLEIEIINTGIPAINSWVIREFAEEIKDYSPDLVILYAGHNEFIGPFGPASVFAPMGSHTFTGFRIWLSGLKIVQEGISLLNNLSSDEICSKGWQGLEMFMKNLLHPLHPSRKLCADNFKKNLCDIRSGITSTGIPILACIPPVNLKDCGPFASLNSPGMDPATFKKWTDDYESGREQLQLNDYFQALRFFHSAESADEHHAGLQYQMGKAYYLAGDMNKASVHFAKACDYDALPVRATSKIHFAITDAFKGNEPETIDFTETFRALSSGGIIGQELIYDHVHLSIQGHHVIAKELFRVIINHEPFRKKLKPRLPGTELTLEKCLAKLGYSPEDKLINLESILSAMSCPPFTLRLDHDKSIKPLKEQQEQILRQPGMTEASLNIYFHAINEGSGSYLTHLRLGRLLLKERRFAEAISYFMHANTINPFNIDLYNNRGIARYYSGDLNDAQEDFERALELAPHFAQSHFNLGLVHSKRNDFTKAIGHYKTAISIDPQLVKAHISLGNLFQKSNRTSEARAVYERAIAINPNSYELYLSYGHLESQCNELEAAEKNYLAAINLCKDPFEACYALGNNYIRLGMQKEALKIYLKGLQSAPDHGPMLCSTAMLMVNSKDESCRKQALELAEKAVTLSGGNDPYSLQVLAGAYYNLGDIEPAVMTAEKALIRAKERNRNNLCEEIENNLKLYRKQMSLSLGK